MLPPCSQSDPVRLYIWIEEPAKGASYGATIGRVLLGWDWQPDSIMDAATKRAEDKGGGCREKAESGINED